MEAYERLLKYARIYTPSDEKSDTVPSSFCQFDLAHTLVRELKEMGVADAQADDKCYVYAKLPATAGLESRPCLGFIAHMDTVSDFCDHPVRPMVHRNYDGGELPLGESGRTLSPKMFPHLEKLKGQTLITTDGTTILGADDKAGIAEIMTMTEQILRDKIPHGPLAIAFTPDEEIGLGPRYFDVEKFGADFAYTLDGSTEGEIQYENFNACSAVFDIRGVNIHPGASKDIMVNAALVAMEINSLLPSGETPRDAEGYQGFYHLTHMEGDVAHAVLHYIVRDHDAAGFVRRQEKLREITAAINEKWGLGTVSLKIQDGYRNMAEVIQNGNMHLIQNARTACETAGVPALVLPIRGGTDGARLSFMGLPCPNLGTGGQCCHGPYEHITAESMEICTRIALELVKIYAR